MEIAASIIEKLSTLPPDKQRQVLAYVDKLHRDLEPVEERSRSSVRGLWKKFGTPLSEAELRSVRDELWGRFPREVSE